MGCIFSKSNNYYSIKIVQKEPEIIDLNTFYFVLPEHYKLIMWEYYSNSYVIADFQHIQKPENKSRFMFDCSPGVYVPELDELIT